jgi:hypothetical protein
LDSQFDLNFNNFDAKYGFQNGLAYNFESSINCDQEQNNTSVSGKLAFQSLTSEIDTNVIVNLSPDVLVLDNIDLCYELGLGAEPCLESQVIVADTFDTDATIQQPSNKHDYIPAKASVTVAIDSW